MSITSDQIRTVGFIHYLADNAADEIEELEKEVAALQAERDELLAALQGVAQMSRCGQLDRFIGEPWLNSVFAAIAKAEGRTE